ncbi:MAG: hypothetical protein ACRC63_02565, partial [Metamycoplasmataceae bacterium]
PATNKNIHGLIGVTPIRFSKADLLNSKIACGIAVKAIDIDAIAIAPPNNWSNPSNDPNKATNINGKMKEKKGPKKLFQKYKLIILITEITR